MQVAEIVSDLTSLQVCESNAALALVLARAESNTNGTSSQIKAAEDNDPDLKRARDLLELHATFKVAHPDGTNAELNEAREAVERVMRTLR